MYFDRAFSTLLNSSGLHYYYYYYYYSNRTVMLCNKVSFWVHLVCFDNHLENDFENNAWKLEHNAEELQEIGMMRK